MKKRKEGTKGSAPHHIEDTVLLALSLPADAAMRLAEAIRNGKLKEFGIFDVTVAEDPQELSTPKPRWTQKEDHRTNKSYGANKSLE